VTKPQENTVDKVVTEWGIESCVVIDRARATALIAIRDRPIVPISRAAARRLALKSERLRQEYRGQVRSSRSHRFRLRSTSRRTHDD